MKTLYELYDLEVAVDNDGRKHIFIWNKDGTKIKLLGITDGSKNIFDMVDTCAPYNSFRRRINKGTSLGYNSEDQYEYYNKLKEISAPLFASVSKRRYTPEEILLLQDSLNDPSLIDYVVAERNKEEISDGREF